MKEEKEFNFDGFYSDRFSVEKRIKSGAYDLTSSTEEPDLPYVNEYVSKKQKTLDRRQSLDYKLSATSFDFGMDQLFKYNKKDILNGATDLSDLVRQSNGDVMSAMNTFKDMALKLMFDQDSEKLGVPSFIENPLTPGEGNKVSRRKERTLAGMMTDGKRVLNDRDLQELMESKFNIYLDRERNLKAAKARKDQLDNLKSSLNTLDGAKITNEKGETIYKAGGFGLNLESRSKEQLKNYYKAYENIDIASMNKYDRGLALINNKYKKAVEDGLLATPGAEKAQLKMLVDSNDGRGQQEVRLVDYYQNEINTYKKQNDKKEVLTTFLDYETGDLINKVDYYSNEYNSITQRLKIEKNKKKVDKKEIKKLEQRLENVIKLKAQAENIDDLSDQQVDMLKGTLSDIPLFVDQHIGFLREIHGPNLASKVENLYQESVLQMTSLEERLNQVLSITTAGVHSKAQTLRRTVKELIGMKPDGFLENFFESEGGNVVPEGFTKESWIKFREELAEDQRNYHTEHEAIKRLYLNNESLVGEDRASFSDFIGNVKDSVDDYYRGKGDLKQIDVIRKLPELYSLIGANLTIEESDYMKSTFGDKIAELGYSAKFLLDIYGAGKILKVGKYLIGGTGRGVINYGAQRYSSVKKLQKFLRAKNSIYSQSVAESYITPTFDEAFKFLLADRAGSGEWRAESAVLGGSFGAASRAMGGLTKSLFAKRPLAKKLFDATLGTSGSFIVASNFSGLFEGGYKELLGHDDFTRFVEDKYSSVGKVAQDLAVESIFAMSLGLRKNTMGLVDYYNNTPKKLKKEVSKIFDEVNDKLIEAKIDVDGITKDYPMLGGGVFNAVVGKKLFDWYVKKHGPVKGKELYKKEYELKAELAFDFMNRAQNAKRWSVLDFEKNPGKTIEYVKKDNEQLQKDYKKITGNDLKIEVLGNKEFIERFGESDKANYDPKTKTLTYNTGFYNLAEGTSVIKLHEGGHVIKYAKYGTDFRYKTKYLNILKTILKDVKLDTMRSAENPKEQMSMLEYINTRMEFNTKDAKSIEKLKEHEIFTYIAENYHLISGKNGSKLKDWIIRSTDAAFGRKQKYDLHKEEDVRRWFADYARTTRNGGSVIELFEWMDRVVDIPTSEIINKQVTDLSVVVKSEGTKETTPLFWIKEGKVDASKLSSEVQRLYEKSVENKTEETFFKNLSNPTRHPSSMHPLVGNKLGPYIDVVIENYNKNLVSRGLEDFVIDMSSSSRAIVTRDGIRNYESLYNTIKTEMAFGERGVMSAFKTYDPNKESQIMTHVVNTLGRRIHEIREGIEGKKEDAATGAKGDVDFDFVPDASSPGSLGNQSTKPTSEGIQLKKYPFKTNGVERTIETEDIEAIEVSYKKTFEESTTLDTYFNTAKSLETQTKVITDKILGLHEGLTTPKAKLAVAGPNFRENAEIFLRSFPNYSSPKFYENSQIGKSILKVFYKNTGETYKSSELPVELTKKTNARTYKYEKLEVTPERVEQLINLVLSGPSAGAKMTKIQTAAKYAGDVIGVQHVRDMFDVTTEAGKKFKTEVMERKPSTVDTKTGKTVLGDYVNPGAVNKYMGMTTQLAIERLRGATPEGVKSSNISEDSAKRLIEKIKGINFVETKDVGFAMALIMEKEGVPLKFQKRLLKRRRLYSKSVRGLYTQLVKAKRELGKLDSETVVVEVFESKYKQINGQLAKILKKQGYPEELLVDLLAKKADLLRSKDFIDQYHGTRDIKDEFGNVIEKGTEGFVQKVLKNFPKEILVKYNTMLRSSFTLNGIEKILGSKKTISADEGKAIMEGIEGVETVLKPGQKNPYEYLNDVNMVNNSDLRRWHKKLMKNKKYQNLDPSTKKGQENLNDYVGEIRKYLKGKGSKSYMATVKANRKLQVEIVSQLREYYVGSTNKAQAIANISFLLQGQTSNIGGFGRSLATHTRFTTELGEIYPEHAFALANWSGNTLLNIVNTAGNKASFLKKQKLLSEKYHQMVIPERVQKIIDNAENQGTTGFVEYAAKDFKAFDVDVNYLLHKEQLSKMVDIESGKTLSQLNDGYTRAADVVLKLKNQISLSANLSEGFVNSKSIESLINMSHKIDKAISLGRLAMKKSRGFSAFDFDETLIIKGKNYVYATHPTTKEVLKINSEDFAERSKELYAQGYKMDFKDFANVTGGVDGPLLQKLKNRINKFGVDNTFIVTARPVEANIAIQQWLKTKGIDLPLENITGLADGRPEAKAMWMLEKYSQGYNDMYFVDDALPNVKAVKDVLKQLDVKYNVQQAIAVRSKNIGEDFAAFAFPDLKGDISAAKGRMLGKNKYTKSIIVPGAQDFKGLLQNFVGKGKQGELQQMFFNEVFHEPYAKAYNEINSASQSLTTDYSNLGKIFKGVVKKLDKELPGMPFTYDQAIRVHRWTEAGYKIPDLLPGDVKIMYEAVVNDPKLLAFSDNLAQLSKQEMGYIKPTQNWTSETIVSDLSNMINKNGRTEYFKVFRQNRELIFGKWENGKLVGPNMAKIEATQGPAYKDALEDMLWRMETGSNRPAGKNKLVNMHMNFINGSVGATMFLNTRSATLQTLSTLNYINWSDNNPLKAGAAFANQQQYWADFSYIFNSDMLKQRRSGLKYNVQEAEIAQAAAGSKNKAQAAFSYLLKIGFTPTQIADSFAISAGGASFYRNRIKTYINQGLSGKEAKEKAWIDFQETTETAQQSSRPDLISQQQAGPMGRMIFAWGNTPMQYARIQEKAVRDLLNNRGSKIENFSKLSYYGFIQSTAFTAMQNALFAFSLDSENSFDDLVKDQRFSRSLNNMLDSQLRGIGIPGAILSTVKNTVVEYQKQSARGYNADHTRTMNQLLSYSPVLGSKFRKIFGYSGVGQERFNAEANSKIGFSIDNPRLLTGANIIEASTNLPTARILNKVRNLRIAADFQYQWWQNAAAFGGWSGYELGIENTLVDDTKKQIKIQKILQNKLKPKKPRIKL